MNSPSGSNSEHAKNESVHSDLNIGQSNSGHSSRSTKSPVIVTTNADYKRPNSTSTAASQNDNKSVSLERNWVGLIFLSIHFLLGLSMVIVSLFDLFWCFVGIVKPIIRQTQEINSTVLVVLSIFTFSTLIISFKYMASILFSSNEIFKKNYLHKKLTLFLVSSVGVCFAGLFCVAIHIYIWNVSKVTHLTPYLPCGIFLILHGLLNVQLSFELSTENSEGISIILPYKVDNAEENKDYDNMEELSDISNKVSLVTLMKELCGSNSSCSLWWTSQVLLVLMLLTSMITPIISIIKPGFSYKGHPGIRHASLMISGSLIILISVCIVMLNWIREDGFLGHNQIIFYGLICISHGAHCLIVYGSLFKGPTSKFGKMYQPYLPVIE